MRNTRTSTARAGLGFLSLAVSATSMIALNASGAHAQGAATLSFEEITVTAQRREQSLSDVPISLSAFGQERLDVQGVRRIDDVVRLTPGVTFGRADARNGLAANIAIRGIASTAGAGTTGIYIDDTPIQIRSLGYSSFNSFPSVFDIERIEVLRGPQGTLFGAGSEGGTVRFITPDPSFDAMRAYARSEMSFTEHGDASYEGGVAIGGPIVSDKLAVRVSGWFRKDGGFVDRTDWDRTTIMPTNTLDKNANWQDTTVLKAAFTFTPTESLKVTPSIYHQNLKLNDSPTFWANLSDIDSGAFFNGNALSQVSRDKFTLPALKIEWDLGFATLVSNTSYFERKNHSQNDYTAFEFGIWARNPFFPAGAFAPTQQFNDQENFTQEIRLQSNDGDSRLNWVFGAFYWDAKQTARQFVQDTFLPAVFFANVGVPFEVAFGQGLADGLYTFVADPIVAKDKQIAGFGQLDFDLTEALTVTAGLRVSHTKMDASADYRGPVVGPTVSDTGSQSETPVTPKAGVSYKIDQDNMVYASAAKGFRIGGYNPRVGAPCTATLNGLGLNGTPPLYESDSVWSYEIGAKNALADGRVRLNSSAFYVDWSNIQQSVGLPACGFQFVANLGSATSKGFDVQIEAEPVDNLLVTLAFGYTLAKFDETVKGGPAATTNLVTAGDHIPGSPWTGAFAVQYNFPAFGQEGGYARLDYQYQSRQTSLTPANNPLNGSFNPNTVFQLPQTNLLSARVGARLSDFDVSVFVNNLLDSNTVLSLGAAPSAPGQPTVRQLTTHRPRTVGVTAIFRY